MAKKLSITPLHDRVIVKPAAAEEKTAGGIIIPDTVKEKPQRGEVVALGSGRLTSDGKKVAFNVKVGDIVLFKKYSPDEIDVDGQEYLIMDEEAVLAIVK